MKITARFNEGCEVMAGRVFIGWRVGVKRSRHKRKVQALLPIRNWGGIGCHQMALDYASIEPMLTDGGDAGRDIHHLLVEIMIGDHPTNHHLAGRNTIEEESPLVIGFVLGVEA